MVRNYFGNRLFLVLIIILKVTLTIYDDVIIIDESNTIMYSEGVYVLWRNRKEKGRNRKPNNGWKSKREQKEKEKRLMKKGDEVPNRHHLRFNITNY